MTPSDKNVSLNTPRHRFFLYSAIGLFFGIIDWFYLNWLAHISWGSLGESVLVVPIIIAMNYGIWLVPIIPVVIYETRRAERILYPMLAGVLTWSCAIFSYYAYYAILLSLGKLNHMEQFNIFGDKNDSFWYYYWHMFNGIILNQFFEWITIAVIGGAIIGAVIFWILQKKAYPRTRNIEIQELED